MIGVHPWLPRCPRTRDFCPALAALGGRVKNYFYYFFFTIRYYISFVPIAQQVVMSTISKRKQKCSDIEAYYRNESKTF
jgi:hypothetical protein